MGLYGSPALGPYADEDHKKPEKKEGYKPQRNVWVWAAILVVNIILLLFSGITLTDVLTVLILDSMIVFGISAVSLVANLASKRKTGNDIKFIGFSILAFFIFILILGTL